MNWMRSFLRYAKAFVGQIVLGIIFLLSTAFYFLLFPLLSDPDYYKNQILQNIQDKTGIFFAFDTYEPFFVPFPGIKLNSLSIQKNGREILFVNEAKIEIYPKFLLGQELEFRSVTINGGKFNLVRNKDESFLFVNEWFQDQDLNQDTSKKNDSDFEIDPLLKILPKSIVFQDFTLEWNDKLYDKIGFISFEELILNTKVNSKKLNLQWLGKWNQSPVSLEANVEFNSSKLDFEKIHYQGQVILEDFELYQLQDLLVIFDGADFRKTRVSLNCIFGKVNGDSVYFNVNEIHGRQFAYYGKKPFGDIHLSVKIVYSLTEHKLSFENIRGEWSKEIKLFGSGFVTFTKNPLIKFQARTDYLNAESLEQILFLWTEADLEKSILVRGIPDTNYHKRMKVELDFAIQNPRFQNIKFDQISLGLDYTYHFLSFRKVAIQMEEGAMNLRGNYRYADSKNPGKLLLTGNIAGVRIENVLSSHLESPLVTGQVAADFDIESQGKSREELLNYAILSVRLRAKEGELLRYTNLLRPISSFGSIINLRKINLDRATPYNDLEINTNYKNRKFNFSKFILKGNGIEITGSGIISLDKDIDSKFTIALPGIAGNAIKLPIYFKGKYDKDLPYIDPIWLGSIYAGTIFLAGPAGAPVGGIMGSALSDVVDRTVDRVSDGFKKSWNSLFTKSENQSDSN